MFQFTYSQPLVRSSPSQKEVPPTACYTICQLIFPSRSTQKVHIPSLHCLCSTFISVTGVQSQGATLSFFLKWWTVLKLNLWWAADGIDLRYIKFNFNSMMCNHRRSPFHKPSNSTLKQAAGLKIFRGCMMDSSHWLKFEGCKLHTYCGMQTSFS